MALWSSWRSASAVRSRRLKARPVTRRTLKPRHCSYSTWQRHNNSLPGIFDDILIQYRFLAPQGEEKRNVCKGCMAHMGITSMVNCQENAGKISSTLPLIYA